LGTEAAGRMLTNGRPLVEIVTVNFRGAFRKRIAVAHCGELVGGADEDPDRLPL